MDNILKQVPPERNRLKTPCRFHIDFSTILSIGSGVIKSSVAIVHVKGA